MAIDKFVTAEAAVALIADGDTVALIGGGGGLCEATCLHEAIEKRFLETGHPRGLTVIHSLGIGDRKSRGMNRFAHEGMVKRVIGGHWVWSPRMQQLARDEKIEAYVFPGGVAMQLFREIGAGRPGLFTHVGLGTFVDPRVEGGRMNKAAKDDLIEVVTIDGQELLRYRSFPVNVAVIRGSFADAHGNISLDQEPANVDIYAAALAAHNSGGKVIVQVRTAVEVGALPARSVRVPGAIVDAVVVDPLQSMGYDVVYDPTMSGEIKGPPKPAEPQPFTVRQLIARRAAEELRDGAVLNYGFGIPDGVARLIAERGHLDRYYQTIEHGTYGGELLEGTLFGYARNATAMIDGPSQFDFYSGGGLDIAFLGFGEIDRHRQRERLEARRRDRRPRRLHRYRAERQEGRVLRHVRCQGHRSRHRLGQAAHRPPRRRGEARQRRGADHLFGPRGAQTRAGGRLRHRACRVPADRQGPRADRGGARHRRAPRRARTHEVRPADRARSRGHGRVPLSRLIGDTTWRRCVSR